VAHSSLLAVSADAKTVKGERQGYLTGILYLAPADSVADGLNLCPMATPGCRASCLNTAGRGVFASVQTGRARKRQWFQTDRPGFVAALAAAVWEVTPVDPIPLRSCWIYPISYHRDGRIEAGDLIVEPKSSGESPPLDAQAGLS
jgi:hypothetical protein